MKEYFYLPCWVFCAMHCLVAPTLITGEKEGKQRERGREGEMEGGKVIT
jgi:hypothetical protein